MVGSSLVRFLNKNGFKNLILKDKTELDLLNQKEVNDFLGT